MRSTEKELDQNSALQAACDTSIARVTGGGVDTLTSTFEFLDKRCHPFSPPVLTFNFYRAYIYRVQQPHCKSSSHRVLLQLTHALALSARQFVRKKKCVYPRERYR